MSGQIWTDRNERPRRPPSGAGVFLRSFAAAGGSGRRQDDEAQECGAGARL